MGKKGGYEFPAPKKSVKSKVEAVDVPVKEKGPSSRSKKSA